jgi:hypothetical protein
MFLLLTSAFSRAHVGTGMALQNVSVAAVVRKRSHLGRAQRALSMAICAMAIGERPTEPLSGVLRPCVTPPFGPPPHRVHSHKRAGLHSSIRESRPLRECPRRNLPARGHAKRWQGHFPFIERVSCSGQKRGLAPTEAPGSFEELNPGSLPQLQPNPSSSRSMAPALPGTPLDSVSSPIT